MCFDWAFATRWNHHCWLLPSYAAQVLPFWKKKDHPTAQQHLAPHCLFVDNIQKNGCELWPHPPYCPDLPISDYCLYGFVKHRMWGHRSTYIETVQEAVCHPCICWNGILLQGNLHNPETVAKYIIWDGYFVEKWIQCTDLTDVVFSYSYFWLNFDINLLITYGTAVIHKKYTVEN